MDSGHAPAPLHVLLFPFLAPSHMAAMLDMARLFSDHGAKVSVVTTPGNAHLFHHSPSSISVHLLPFPSSTFNLPAGCENIATLPSSLTANFYSAVFSLREPLSHLLSSLHPDAIISDVVNYWTASIAGDHHIPHVLFLSSSVFAHCVVNDLAVHRPYDSISDQSLPFSIPGFPHSVHLTRSQLPDVFHYSPVLDWMRDAECSSHAIILNSFFALEPEYVEHYYKLGLLRRNLFLPGPVAIAGEPVKKGKKVEPCLEWLDEKEEDGSVVYVAFGTMGRMIEEQIKELALGLEISGERFVWALGSGEVEEWIPEGFERRVEGRGLVLRGWAPQTEILNHPAVGGFMSHCGWNSVLEAVTAGVPVITWPIHSEQFVNEKMLVEVVKVGIPAWDGFKSVKEEEKVVVPAETVAAAVKRLMGSGEEVVAMRKRVAELAQLAWKAVAEGGTSHVDLSRLIDGLIAIRNERRQIKG
ncbi:UDP-glucuronosyl/UDP-glucosyltransferase protein [Dioscorea alata]|uniref:UDP-glucuronosyl/UDP-glucosyltransferase protein n=1 Tax=Dioscorea alata TaxID=55571 RepID=A0ACB7WNV4_DIOAL|nr:UDP-glucuronosyl/UDP-glucosyltransferase protein [Dioscorea alata]